MHTALRASRLLFVLNSFLYLLYCIEGLHACLTASNAAEFFCKPELAKAAPVTAPCHAQLVRGVPHMVTCCTDLEAQNLGVFLRAILGMTERWRAGPCADTVTFCCVRMCCIPANMP